MIPVPVMPVAVKVIGLPVRPALEALRVLAPAVGPRVQLPTVAMPFALVVAAPPVTEPPPLATANATATPLLTFPNASETVTLGATATAVPTVAL
jgi:hypothetical protein